MKTAIFIRTYRGDREWLRLALLTLRRRAVGFCEIVVAMPKGCREHFSDDDLEGARVVLLEDDTCKGYLSQQITKVHADLYTDADFILFSDSDALATKPFAPEEFMAAGRPLQLTRPWKEASSAKIHKRPVFKALGFTTPFEHMATLPLIYHRSTLDLTRKLIRKHTRNEASEYIAKRGEFSEFNVVGAVAHEHQRDLYEWRNANPAIDGYPRPLRQFWSWGGFTEEVKAEIEGILQ